MTSTALRACIFSTLLVPIVSNVEAATFPLLLEGDDLSVRFRIAEREYNPSDRVVLEAQIRPNSINLEDKAESINQVGIFRGDPPIVRQGDSLAPYRIQDPSSNLLRLESRIERGLYLNSQYLPVAEFAPIGGAVEAGTYNLQDFGLWIGDSATSADGNTAVGTVLDRIPTVGNSQLSFTVNPTAETEEDVERTFLGNFVNIFRNGAAASSDPEEYNRCILDSNCEFDDTRDYRPSGDVANAIKEDVLEVGTKLTTDPSPGVPSPLDVRKIPQFISDALDYWDLVTGTGDTEIEESGLEETSTRTVEINPTFEIGEYEWFVRYNSLLDVSPDLVGSEVPLFNDILESQFGLGIATVEGFFDDPVPGSNFPAVTLFGTLQTVRSDNAGSNVDVAAVPLPASMPLLLFALGGLFVGARRFNGHS
jgi:hypothetical protein